MYANLTEHGLNMFKGPFYDYSPGWYATVGYQIVQTMIIYALLPVADCLYCISQKWLEQRHDQGWTCDRNQRLYHTKKTQIYQYIDLYSGPEFVMHVRYSSVLNVTFVTMLYGPGLPILFPIAAFSYFTYYCSERYALAYIYQMPPAMDDMMTKNAL